MTLAIIACNGKCVDHRLSDGRQWFPKPAQRRFAGFNVWCTHVRNCDNHGCCGLAMIFSKSARLGKIVDFLRTSDSPVQASELARLLDCSERTVHRYIDELRGQSIAITSVLGPGGGLVLGAMVADRISISSTLPAAVPVNYPDTRRSPFVGRNTESTTLDLALESALAGNGSVIALVGEAGIGKTRIVEEFAGRVSQLGVESIWCTSQESQGAPSYWPWTQAVRKITALFGEAIASSLPEDAAQRVSSISASYSDVFTANGNAEKTNGADGEDRQRFLLFDAVLQFVKAAARIRPLVIVLEDIHWADPRSLELLEFVATLIDDSNLLIIATARDWQDGGSAATLNELSRHPGFVRHDIARLDRSETRELVETFGSESPEFADEVFRLSEGNAFFAVELSRLIRPVDRQISTAENPVISLPETITETITRRISRLSGQCRDILNIAAVLGHRFDLTVLAGASRHAGPAEIRVFIEEAIISNAVREVDSLNSLFEFDHALVQKTVYDAIVSTDRQLIHGTIAEFLESRRSSGSKVAASEIAHHYRMSADISKREKVVEYSAMAGSEASSVYAFEDAARHFSIAIEAFGDNPVRDEVGELHYGQALALRQMNRPADAIDGFIRAFKIFEQTGNIKQAVRMSYQSIGRGPGEAPQQKQLCEMGLRLVEKRSMAHARILNEYGAVLGSSGQFVRALEIFDESTEIARGLEDALMMARPMISAAFTYMYNMQPDKAANSVVAALKSIEGIDDPQLHHVGHRAAMLAFMFMGETTEARIHSDEAVRFCRIMRKDGWRNEALDEYLACELALLEGRWDDAQLLGNRNLADPNEHWDFGAKLATEFHRGDPASAIVGIIDLCRTGEESMTFHTAGKTELISFVAEFGRVYKDTEATEFAESWATEILNDETKTRLEKSAAECVRALTLAGGVNRDRVKAIYEAITVHRGLWLWPYRAASPDRLLGLLADTMGDQKLAETHFEEAISFCDHANYGPELAWVCFDYASMLLKSGRVSELKKADALVERALPVTARLGMKYLGLRLTNLKRDIRAKSSRPMYPDQLSEREVEVIRLIAKGSTNAEIAAALFITENTVATHVANILNKTDVANRAGAAAYATRNNLVSHEASAGE